MVTFPLFHPWIRSLPLDFSFLSQPGIVMPGLAAIPLYGSCSLEGVWVWGPQFCNHSIMDVRVCQRKILYIHKHICLILLNCHSIYLKLRMGC